MHTFLHNVAATLWERHRNDLENILIVFNNRRAGLFLQKELMALDEKPFFLPRIIGIDDLVQELGDLKITPSEFLLFELYDIYRTASEGNDNRFSTFEEFMSFGEMLIGDFSEIDLYAVDAAKLFNILHEHKKMGEWDIEGGALTEFQANYLSFYKSLYTFYTRLRDVLSGRGEAYMGMAYRQVAERIDTLVTKIKEHDVYFVGFNALSKTEERIIDGCIAHGIGHVIFDGDAHYVDDTNQEAGLFLRSHLNHFSGIAPFPNHFEEKKKTIHIVNCPENVLQAKAAGSILDGIIKNALKKAPDDPDAVSKTLKETAIVLADEKMLLPMMNAMPATVKTANVTMGFPYNLTQVHLIVTQVLSLYANHRNGRFHHDDLLALLSSPLIGNLLEMNDVYHSATEIVNKEKIIFASPQEADLLIGAAPGKERLMFLFHGDLTTVDAVLNNLKRLAENLSAHGIDKDNVKEREALACLLQILDFFEQLHNERHHIDTVATLQRLYDRMAKRRSIAFYGKPLKGLQLLGMLETRSIDFSNLVVLSLNEGTLPAGKSDNSLIPYIIKREFQIPTFREKDAVYAYNFFRLLQRADEAWLLYSSESAGIGKGEPSRFILQIKQEMALRYPNLTVDEYAVSCPREAACEATTQAVAKNKSIMERLATIASKGFSPSMLNRYRGCPRRFLLEDVLEARETDTVSETLESNELGTFIHQILCDIYNIDKDKKIKASTLEKAVKEIDTLVDNSIESEVLKNRDREGKNHLYGEVAKIQIKRFLATEIAKLRSGRSIEMVLTEDEMKVRLPMPAQPHLCDINIKGTTDRVDIHDGYLHVSDYKSGSVVAKELAVDDPQPQPRDVPDKWFQLMTYAWLFHRQHHYDKPFKSGIIPLRLLDTDFMPAYWCGNDLFSVDDIDRFQVLLQSLIEEIFNPDIPFAADPKDKKKTCQYCPFATSCRPQETE